ncbi:MAG TPA: efflux RND transporter permease subunit [Patescibacteria group bacterium]|nr:efflux RND transporter permease subunit [Patescibacteria group bacterium]
MPKIKSYLGQLKFDPSLKDSFIAKYLHNPRLVILVVMLVVLIGSFSLSNIPRVLNPNVNIPYVIVTTVLPGAGPADVESLVTIPIEDSVTGVENVKTVTSTSEDSTSVVTVEFNDGTDPDKARQDVQSAVNQVTGLPTDAQTPTVQKIDFQNVPVWTFVVTSKSDEASLNVFAKILNDNLKNVQTVKSVAVSGLDTQEVEVVIKPSAITTYQLNPTQISQLIKSAISSYPAGNVQTGTSTFSFTIDSAINNVDDIRNLELQINGKPVALSSIADVYEKAQPGAAQSYLATNKTKITRGVTFNVYKTSAASIDQTNHDTEQVVNDTLKQYNNDFSISTVLNTSEQIDKQFSDLYRDFSITVTLVFLTLFVFVGLRQALVALLSTPLTFLITFTVMNLTGIPLSFIAIFSLLLSLGLLVDDTIVVISAMTAYFRSGKFSGFETGLLIWRDFLKAISTTTITTVWAFLPLLLSTGIIGDYIKAIPIVVSATLLGSFFVAMFITLPVLIIILSPNIPNRVKTAAKFALYAIVIFFIFSILPQGRLYLLEILAAIGLIIILFLTQSSLVEGIKNYLFQKTHNNKFVQSIPRFVDHGIIQFESVSDKYKEIMFSVLASSSTRKRILIMVIIFSLFSYLLLPLGFVQNEFFPNSDEDSFSMTLEMPAGTNLQTTTNEALRLLDNVRKTPNIQFVSLDVGSSGSSSMGGSGSSGDNLATFSFVLPPANQRKEGSMALAQKLRDQFAGYNTGTLQVVEESSGPPAGADVQIKLFGSDLTTLDTYANKIENYLNTQPGLTNIDKSIKSGTSKIVFTPDKAKMTQYGLTPDQIGIWIRLFASGMKADDIQFATDTNQKTDITIRMSNNSEFVENINSIQIPTQNGNIPLISLGTLTLQPNPTLITRESGKRTISVTASVKQGYSISKANANLAIFANNKLDLPTGYSWDTGGVNQQNQESVTSILQAMLLSFLLIIITMVVQFNSFRKALIVMLVIPLSISGVFILFALTNTPLSFPALIGVLALFGIVVKNSILIVDKINQNYRMGMAHIEAVVDAAASRLEPIALTSFATITGLIPITLSDPLWRGLGGAIIAGLSFSGTIMLFFIPVVYYYWFRNEEDSNPE